MNKYAYLMYEKTEVVGGNTFYFFRIVLIPDGVPFTLYKTLPFLDPTFYLPAEMELIDIPIMVPESIHDGETFSVYGGLQGTTWSAPEDMVFLYAKGTPFTEGSYPTSPGEEDVVVSTSMANRPQIIYCSITNPATYPAGDDPEGKTIGEDGFAFPLYNTFSYQEKDVAGRYLSPWYYTDVRADRLYVWQGCTDWEMDEDHFLSNTPASIQYNHTLRYSEPNYIYSCNEESGTFPYWVERETIGDIETTSIWLFEASEPFYFYPFLVNNPAEAPGLLIDMLPLLAIGLISALQNFGCLQHVKMGRLASNYRYYPFGGATSKPLGGATSKPLGGKV